MEKSKIRKGEGRGLREQGWGVAEGAGEGQGLREWGWGLFHEGLLGQGSDVCPETWER